MLESLTCLSSSRQLIEFGSIWLSSSFLFVLLPSRRSWQCAALTFTHSTSQQKQEAKKENELFHVPPPHTKLERNMLPLFSCFWDEEGRKKLMRSEWAEKISIHTPHSGAMWKKKQQQQQNMMNYELLENVLFFTIFFLLLYGERKGWRHIKTAEEKVQPRIFTPLSYFAFFLHQKKSFFGSLLWK